MKSCPSDDNQVNEQASLWVTRIDENTLSEKERSDFFSWVKSSPSHKAAFQKLAKKQLSIREMLNSAPAPAKRAPYSTKFRFYTQAFTASILVGFLGLGGWLWKSEKASTAVNAIAAEYHTKIGEQRTIPLDDGSFITLNTQSHVKVNYSATHRRLTLVEGEAYFDVERDVGRPFEVSVDGRKVRALGTEFSIQQKSNQLEVIVTEGRIQIAEDNTHHAIHNNASSTPEQVDLGKTKDMSTIAYLDQGQKAQLSKANDIVISEITAKATAQHLAWRQSMLIFDGESLAEVINEMSRYSDIQIKLADPSLKDLKIGGYFKAHDIKALTATIASQFNIDMHQNTAGEIILSREASTPNSTQTNTVL